MKIGIDARLIHETGVGRYIRNLIGRLIEIDTKNTYVVYLLKGTRFPFELPHERWSIRWVSTKWHSIHEQLLLPFIYAKDTLDILHVPYFTVPLLYRGTIITTIHDLTILRVTTGKASTLPYPLYVLKKIGYRFVLERGLKKAKYIIAVSETTKKDVVNTFNITNPITVTYEGVDDVFLNSSTAHKSPTNQPYVVYVGNAYPHKNVSLLLNIAKLIRDRSRIHKIRRSLTFVMVGPSDYFYDRLKDEVMKNNLQDMFIFPKNVTDAQLVDYFSSALVTVSPSLAEGFALPLLESLAANCPILVSDIPVFRELLPKATQFLPTDKAQPWVEAIELLLDTKKTSVWQSEDEKHAFFKNFSWLNMARETLKVYEKSCET